MKQRLVVGTRGSALALAQVALFEEALRQNAPAVSLEVRKIATRGDVKVNASLARATPAGAKGLFTKEIEDALLRKEIDVAVHSLKDLPGALPEGLAVVSVLPRAKSGDVLVTRDGCPFDSMPAGALLGTSSVRREKQLLRLRPDLRVREIRGNVPTRLRRLREQKELHGIVLAEAGLERLGFFSSPVKLEGLQIESLNDRLLPAVGQGIIALEARTDAPEIHQILATVCDDATWSCARAEREFLRLLNGDCRLPVGVRTFLSGGLLSMSALVFDGENGEAREAEASHREPEVVAERLFRTLYES